MVHLGTVRKMRHYWDNHLEELVRSYGGKYVLIERGDDFKLKHIIFKRNSDYEKALEPYRNRFHPGVFSGRIPMRYKKPWSLKTPLEQAEEVHKDTFRYLRKLDEVERRTKKSRLRLD